jgi:hypothetical protein
LKQCDRNSGKLSGKSERIRGAMKRTEGERKIAIGGWQKKSKDEERIATEGGQGHLPAVDYQEVDPTVD